jgi:hypothetical protein
MPLRDHFRPPLDLRHSWEELHGGWPMVIVQQLRSQLPAGYEAAPSVHLGAMVEVDVATYERDDDSPSVDFSDDVGGGGTATAVSAPALPSLDIETDFPDCDEYEVRIYDARRERKLVAAIELVSPSNKDRQEHRNAFVGKCAAMLRKGVAVSIVDLVTVRNVNLYAELLDFLGQRDPALGATPPAISAVSCRWITRGRKAYFQAWTHSMAVGQPLPTIPLCLGPDRAILLNLEESYERACHDLWIA